MKNKFESKKAGVLLIIFVFIFGSFTSAFGTQVTNTENKNLSNQQDLIIETQESFNDFVSEDDELKSSVNNKSPIIDRELQGINPFNKMNYFLW